MFKIRDSVMVFNPIFNNISLISWRSVLMVGETGVPEENHRPVPSHWQTLSQNPPRNDLKQTWNQRQNV
jgi:hypothetical protein